MGKIRLKNLVIATATAIVMVISPASARDAEPPIVRANDMLGRAYQTQTYTVPSLALVMGNLSIADLYRLTNGSGKPIPALAAPLECEIDDTGSIVLARCQPVDLQDEVQRTATRIVRLSAGFREAPRFPAIDRVKSGTVPMFNDRALPFNRQYAGGNPSQKKPPLYRLARLTVQTDPIPAPQVDLASGPLVERQQLPAIAAAFADGSSGLTGDVYPARALRAAITGRETVECQVQSDLSLICRMASFDPPANADYFVGVAEGLFRHTRVAEILLNGQAARGVRFRFPINWAIPH